MKIPHKYLNQIIFLLVINNALIMTTTWSFKTLYQINYWFSSRVGHIQEYCELNSKQISWYVYDHHYLFLFKILITCTHVFVWNFLNWLFYIVLRKIMDDFNEMWSIHYIKFKWVMMHIISNMYIFFYCNQLHEIGICVGTKVIVSLNVDNRQLYLGYLMDILCDFDRGIITWYGSVIVRYGS